MIKNILSVLTVLSFVLMAAPAMAASVKTNPSFEYYEVPPVMLPVVTADGVTHQVGIAVALELPFGKRDAIAIYGPRLVDAYIRDLFGALGSGQMMVKGGHVLDLEQLKSRLETVTNRVLGDDRTIVKNLYLQAVQQHKI